MLALAESETLFAFSEATPARSLAFSAATPATACAFLPSSSKNAMFMISFHIHGCACIIPPHTFVCQWRSRGGSGQKM